MKRRGQEEIVGFVVVVVLIAIVLLIFLSLSLRSSPETRESVTVSQFMDSMFSYTTNCSFNGGSDFASVGEALSGCAQGRLCEDHHSSCETLNMTVPFLIEAGLKVGENRPLKGYTFSARLVTPNSTNPQASTPLYGIGNGNCSGNQQKGSSEFHPAGGLAVRSELIVCS